MFDRIRQWAEELAGADLPAPEAAVIEEIRALEQLKCAAEARQARLAAALPDTRGTAHEVALARRESPHKGRRHLSLARILPAELPHTAEAFRAGRITEWRATIIARGTAFLSREGRAEVDRLVAGDADRLEAMGDREIEDAVRALAARLEPAAVVERLRHAETERRVTIRPAPDAMAWVTALLPVAQGVSVWATLKRAADSARAAGDPRGEGQVMADALVARVFEGTATSPAPVPVAVNLLVSDRVLLGEQEDAAHLDGYGSIPAELARVLCTDESATRTLRRVYADPRGRIVAMDSRARRFGDGLAALIRLRDRFCRTAWCGAPIRNTDHLERHADGGATSEDNGEGTCEACNQAKEARGWSHRPRPGPRHTVEVRTPTGHAVRSRAPDAWGRFPDPVHVTESGGPLYLRLGDGFHGLKFHRLAA